MESFLGMSLELLIILAVNFFFILVLFIMNLSNRSKIRKLKQKYLKLMNGVEGVNLEEVIVDCIDKVKGVIEKNKALDYEINAIQRNMYHCVQKVGVVRYNAFDNVGSDLSFSIALMDNNDDGVVISSLYSRDSSSTYAKPVSSAKSKYALSAEELKAIDIARKESNANKYRE